MYFLVHTVEPVLRDHSGEAVKVVSQDKFECRENDGTLKFIFES